MKYRLIVMRHAKSDWETNAPTDHARPLNKRGRRDAPQIAAKLVELGWQPDRVLSSDSQRTTETFERMSGSFVDPGPEVAYFNSLYHAGIAEIEEVVSLVPDEVECVQVLGHNPGWQSAVYWLTGEAHDMTTANAALMEIEAKNWVDAISRETQWELVEFLRPKEL